MYSTLLVLLLAPFSLLFECLTALWLNFTGGLLMTRKKLSGKKVLITGSAMGLGEELAIQLAKKGAHLILWDVCEEANQKVAEMCRKHGVPASSYKVDVSSRRQVYETAERVQLEIGDPDIVINNAGIARQEYFTEKKDDLMEKTVQINTIGHFWIAKAFYPRMLEKDNGHLVCIASAAGLFGCSGMTDYSSSKAGVIAFTEALETECKVLNKSGVKFTTVCPGFIATRLCTAENFPAAANKEQMTPHEAATEVISAIELEQSILLMPKIFYMILALKGILPRHMYQRLLISLLWKEQAEANRVPVEGLDGPQNNDYEAAYDDVFKKSL